MAYLERYALLDQERARAELAALSRPFGQAYIFTSAHGRRLVEAALDGPRRAERLRWLMTEQVLPSELPAGGPRG